MSSKESNVSTFLHSIWGLLIGCYILVVIYITLLSRSAVYSYSEAYFTPFYSYKMAWDSHSLTQWMNIIFNYIMFIPLGFLLPCGFTYFRKHHRTYLAGLLCTIAIELTQLIGHLGIFEIDDIIDNFLGCVIGYGIFELCHFIILKITKRKASHTRAILSQIPLVIVCITFTTIFSLMGIYTIDFIQYLMR